MRAWYIDSLDARGGIAFASLRDAESDYQEDTPKSLQHAYIAPPYFVPTLGVNRATALGAGRACFQLGFFAEDTEVAFPSLEALAEFVRRVYLRSNGNADGPGGSPIPRAPEGGAPDSPAYELDEESDYPGDAEPQRNEDSGYVVKMRALLSEMKKVGEVLSPGKDSSSDLGEQLAELQSFYQKEAAATLPNLLGSAVEILDEVLRRIPTNLDPHAMRIWLEASKRLDCCFSAIGIWSLFRSESRLEKRLSYIVITNAHRWSRTAWGSEFTRETSFPPVVSIYALRSLLRVGPTAFVPSLPFSIGELEVGPIDGVDILKHLPAPPRLIAAIDWDDELSTDISLEKFLWAFLGSPRAKRDDALVFDVLLFCSTLLVSNAAMAQRTLFYGWHDFELADPDVSRASTEDVVRLGLRWLFRSFPSYAYATRIERAITLSLSLRYELPADEPQGSAY